MPNPAARPPGSSLERRGGDTRAFVFGISWSGSSNGFGARFLWCVGPGGACVNGLFQFTVDWSVSSRKKMEWFLTANKDTQPNTVLIQTNQSQINVAYAPRPVRWRIQAGFQLQGSEDPHPPPVYNPTDLPPESWSVIRSPGVWILQIEKTGLLNTKTISVGFYSAILNE